MRFKMCIDPSNNSFVNPEIQSSSRKRKTATPSCEEADYKGAEEFFPEKVVGKKIAKVEDFAHIIGFQGDLVDRFLNPPRNLLDLPCEILEKILEFSCPVSILTTNKCLQKIVVENRLFNWTQIESSKEFWVSHWVDVLKVSQKTSPGISLESRFQRLFFSLHRHAGKRTETISEIPYGISHFLSLSKEIERQEEISLLAAWPNMREALLEAASEQGTPEEEIPALFAEAGEIRTWLADKKNKPLISSVVELDFRGSAGVRNGVELAITLIPREIRRFTRLQELSFAGHRIRHIAEENFSGLSRLVSLNISGGLCSENYPNFHRMRTLPSLRVVYFLR